MANPSEASEASPNAAAIARTRRALQDDLAAERRRLVVLRTASVLAAVGIALGFAAPISHPVLFGAWATVLLLLGIFALVIFVGTFFFNEIELLEHRLALLDLEATDLESARELAASPRPFALYLRSFAPELRGLSQAAVRRAEITRARQMIFQARYGEIDLEYDASHLQAGARWQAELALLAAIGRRIPVVLLANLQIGPAMRRELRAKNVRELVVQANDWWPVVTELSESAAATFFLVEDASEGLVREMEHVLAHSYPYVILGEAREIDRLATVFAAGRSFIAGALEIVHLREAGAGGLVPVDATVLERLSAQLGS